MNSLFQAVYNRFSSTTGSGFYNDVSGRAYLKKAPQGATFPYCVYFNAADDTEYDFSDEREEILMQFNVFSQNSSALQAGQLSKSLKAMFDNCTLTVTGWNHLEFRRLNPGHSNDDLKQDPPIYGYSVEYNVLLEKARS